MPNSLLRHGIAGLLLVSICGTPGAGWGAREPAPRRATGRVQFAPPPPWVQAVSLRSDANPSPEPADGGIRVVLVDYQTRVGKGNEETYVRLVRRIENETGLADASQLIWNFDPTYEELILHAVVVRRGSTSLNRLAPEKVEVIQREQSLEDRIYDGALTALLLLEDTRVGDVVDTAYTRRGANPALEGRFSANLSTEWAHPVERWRWRLLWPRDRRLSVKTHRTPAPAAVREIGPLTEYLWELTEPATVHGDGEVPGWYEPWGWIQIGEFPQWADVVAWGVRLYAVPRKLPPKMQAAVAGWASADASARDRCLRALRFVQDEIRYLGIEMGTGSLKPSDPGAVFERRFGDCKDKALLLVSMIRAMGIQAWPALVNTWRGEALDEWLPGPLAFNHVVVAIEIDGSILWVDPTLSAQGGGLESTYFPDYRRALVLRPGETSLTRIPPKPLQEPSTVVRDRYRIQDLESPVDLEVETQGWGRDADSLRGWFRRGIREEIGRSYLNYYARVWPSIQAGAPVEFRDDRETNTVTVVEKYSIPDFWKRRKDGRERWVELRARTIEDHLRGPATRVRSTPLFVEHPRFVRHLTVIDLPQAWKVEPEDSTVTGPALDFSYHSQYRNRRVTLQYDLRTRADNVMPADFAQHLESLESIQNSLAYSLTHAVVPQTPAPEGVNWTAWIASALFLPLLCLAFVRAYRYSPPAVAEVSPGPGPCPPPLPPLRFGGWLYLVGFGLVLSPLMMVRTFWALLPTYTFQTWHGLTTPGAPGYHPLWAPVLIFELLGNLALAAGALLLIVLFFKKRRSFPKAFVAVRLLTIAVFVADLVFTGQIPTLPPETTHEAVQELVRAAIGAGIWIPYMLRSQRVLATFVNR